MPYVSVKKSGGWGGSVISGSFSQLRGFCRGSNNNWEGSCGEFILLLSVNCIGSKGLIDWELVEVIRGGVFEGLEGN